MSETCVIDYTTMIGDMVDTISGCPSWEKGIKIQYNYASVV